MKRMKVNKSALVAHIVLICFVLFCTLPTLLLVTSSLSDNDSVFCKWLFLLAQRVESGSISLYGNAGADNIPCIRDFNTNYIYRYDFRIDAYSHAGIYTFA